MEGVAVARKEDADSGLRREKHTPESFDRRFSLEVGVRGIDGHH